MSKRGPYRKRDPWLRIWEKIDPCRTDGCWIWLGGTTKAGYGTFSYGVGEKFYSHWIFVGQPLKGLNVDHVKAWGCMNRNCCNPDHLEIVAAEENIRRGDHSFWAGKTHCPLGHPYSGDNLRVYQGRRFCRACQKIKAHEFWMTRSHRGGRR